MTDVPSAKATVGQPLPSIVTLARTVAAELVPDIGNPMSDVVSEREACTRRLIRFYQEAEAINHRNEIVHSVPHQTTDPMNHILNDRGETVLSVGAPGSMERVRAIYPRLIGELAEIRMVASEDKSPEGQAIGYAAMADTIFRGGVIPGAGERGPEGMGEIGALLELAGNAPSAAGPVFEHIKVLRADEERRLRIDLHPAVAPANPSRNPGLTV